MAEVTKKKIPASANRQACKSKPTLVGLAKTETLSTRTAYTITCQLQGPSHFH